MSFADDLGKFERKVDRRYVDLRENVALALFAGVIKASPVGNPELWASQQHLPIADRKGPEGYVGGRFRANWNCNLGSIDRKTTKNVDPSGSGAISFVIETVSNAPSTMTIYLTNSLPYAHRLEYDAWSKQAPAGMVRLNVVRFRKIIKQQLAKLK